MAILGQSIAEFDFFPDAPAAIVGTLVPSGTVNIQLWEDGNPVSITNSGCVEIGSTGKYSWSTNNIETLNASRQQFHWNMTDGSNTDDGDFILSAHENRDGGMPGLDDQSSYIKKV